MVALSIILFFYSIFFPLLLPALGPSAAIFGIVPVVISGSLFGISSGVYTGIILFLINLTVIQFSGMDFVPWLKGGGFLGSLALISTGGLIGHFSAIRRNLVLEIAARNKAELAERQIKDLLNLTGRTAKVGGWELDLLTSTLLWTEETYRIHGLDPSNEPSVEDAINYYAPNARDTIRNAVDHLIETGESYDLTLPFIRSNGENIWIRTIGNREIRDGEVVRLFGSFQDVNRLKLTETALENSEAEFKSITENAMDGVFRTSADGQILFANSGLARMFGYDSVEEIMTVNTSELYRKPNQRDELIRHYGADGRLVGRAVEFKRKDGSLIWVRISGQMIVHSDGSLKWYEGFLSDITEAKQMEQELLKIQKLESIGELAGGIAHDFNNALFEIRLNAMVALETMDLTPEVANTLKSIERSVDNTVGITRQLITYSKGGKPVQKPTNIKRFLEDSVQFSLSGAGLDVEFEIDDGLLNSDIDKGQITQVISNLILNARQAMGSEGLITVGAKNILVENLGEIGDLVPGDYIQIDITDEGIGIPAENLSKIFDPFYTSKAVGGGLGLYSCYNIVRYHSGWITAKSEIEMGSTFTFYLPATLEKESKQADKTTQVEAGKILIMDDNYQIRKILKTLLIHIGLDVITSADGEEAIREFEAARVSNSPFDVVILDLTIPNGMGGQETAKIIKGLEPTVQIIVASGDSDGQIMSNFEKYGFSAALVKPFELSDLAATIQKCLDSK